jgi:hypothetical protein
MLSYAKSRTAGKWLLFLSIILFAMCFYNTSIAQDSDTPSLKIVYLDQDDGLLANPTEIVLIPGDSLKFVAINGDFDILIDDAVIFLKIKVSDLKFRVDSSVPTKVESDIYIVRDIEIYDENYSIYCISNNSWPAAPPRIIIQSSTDDQ